MIRATAISLLAGYQTEAARYEALQGLNDPEEIVRAASVRALEPPGNLDDQSRKNREDELLKRLVPLLRDPVRTVRAEAARLLSPVASHRFSETDRQAFDAALGEYMTGQESLNDQPEAHLNMAVVYENLQQWDKAEKAYLDALRVDPDFFPTYNNLGRLYSRRGKPAEAEKQFRQATQRLKQQVANAEKIVELSASTPNGKKPAPHASADQQYVDSLRWQLGEAYYAMGLLLAENESRLPDAIAALAEAAQIQPGNARIHYNLGLAYQKAGQAKQGETALTTAIQNLARTGLPQGAGDLLHPTKAVGPRRPDRGAAPAARPAQPRVSLAHGLHSTRDGSLAVHAPREQVATRSATSAAAASRVCASYGLTSSRNRRRGVGPPRRTARGTRSAVTVVDTLDRPSAGNTLCGMGTSRHAGLSRGGLRDSSTTNGKDLPCPSHPTTPECSTRRGAASSRIPPCRPRPWAVSPSRQRACGRQRRHQGRADRLRKPRLRRSAQRDECRPRRQTGVHGRSLHGSREGQPRKSEEAEARANHGRR